MSVHAVYTAYLLPDGCDRTSLDMNNYMCLCTGYLETGECNAIACLGEGGGVIVSGS